MSSTQSILFCGLALIVILLTNGGSAILVNSEYNPGNRCHIELAEASTGGGVVPVLNKTQAAFLLILGFGGFSLFLAVLYRFIRTRIYHDVNRLDSTFDAGGNITWSLTAVTVASQFFWPGDMLHSATLTAKIGVAGCFWYSVGVLVNILMFPVFSVSLKTTAPGAKTYLQIFRARYGRRTHIVFCGFALATTTMIMTSTLLAGKAMIQSLVEDVSDEFVLMTMAFLFGSYSLVGGLGTTFYVSYFNACLVFVILITFAVKVVYLPPHDAILSTRLGNITALYEAMVCLVGPEGNTNRSYLTFQSNLGFLYGTLSLLLGTATTFCDQALWQSRIAAKPLAGVWGFLVGGLIWFTVPMTMATATGIGYLVLSFENGTHLLTPNEINEGLVTPLVAERVLGQAGGVMVLTMGTMALMSTGSGEVMGLASIIIYDIYQIYIQPFRKYIGHMDCVSCGKPLPGKALTDSTHEGTKRGLICENTCSCVSVDRCEGCLEDVRNLQHAKKLDYNCAYKCRTHGAFRAYQDKLVQTKNWCILFITVCLIPYGLIIFGSGIDLNWMFYCGSIFIIPCFIPVILSITWAKATAAGLTTGAISGLVCGVTSALIASSTLEGGLSNFLNNTAHEFTITIGCYTAFAVSLILSIVVSLFTHKIKNGEDLRNEWEKTQQIDNPLNPWHFYYKPELEKFEYTGRPSLGQLAQAFKPARYSALIGGLVLVVIGLGVMPGIMAIFPVLNMGEFAGWITFCHVWAVVMAIVVVFVAPIEEIVKVLKQRRLNKRKTSKSQLQDLGATDSDQTIKESLNHISHEVQL